MICPRCKRPGASLTTPDYGYGYGAEYACYGCDAYGYRFSTNDRRLSADESRQGTDESVALRATSAVNAKAQVD